MIFVENVHNLLNILFMVSFNIYGKYDNEKVEHLKKIGYNIKIVDFEKTMKVENGKN